MRKRLLAVTAALALMVGGLVVTASPANAHCSGHGTHPDRYSAGRIDWGNGTAIRSQPHIGCSVRGRGYASHGIDVHCIVRTGAWWFYARNTTTGVNGWAREDALNINYPITIPVCSSAAATSSDASTPETVTLTG